MKYAINYADVKFKAAQKFNTKTAYKKGKFDKVLEYGPEDIDLEFKRENNFILNSPRGGGYWLWKPYIIRHALQQIEWGDYLFYCDSGAFYCNSIDYLIKTLEEYEQDILVFENPLIEKQWTKGDCFYFMGCNTEEYTNTNQRIATYFLMKKTNRTLEFIDEYLRYCCNKNIISDLTNIKGKNYEEFIDHRHDQSIFSLLTKKYKIDSFREPSQYGDRPWEYLSDMRLFSSKKYINSHYPRIIVSYRKANPLRFYLKERVKDILQTINLRFI
ncbi:hypothetical protein [Bacillus sp. E214]|uniref:hypothetical protein n=1 Tax=Bacillus sp. E214 TaxID=2587156 RepID=UPI0011DF4939|nr:hypothetical protein [Bacillus sp. E214]